MRQQTICPSWAPIRYAVLASFGLAATASASITRGSPSGQPVPGFRCVGELGTAFGYTASAVVVGDGGYLLTARHAVTTDSTLTGQLRNAGDLRFCLDGITYTAAVIRADFSADIALVTLGAKVPAAASLWTLGDEVGRLFVAAGYGATDANSDGQWDSVRDHQRREFSNRIDSIQTGGLVGQGQVLRYDFDLTIGDPVGEDEGLPGPGDSGGGLFIWDGQQYLLAGILSSSGSPVDQATASAVRLMPVAAAIAAAIPEPSGLGALLVVSLSLVQRRRPARG